MKNEEIKNHKNQIEIIEQFKKTISGKFISKNKTFNGRVANFKPFRKEFKVEFNYDIFPKIREDIDIGKYYKGIQIQLGTSIYNLESISLNSHNSTKFTGRIDRIHTNGFSENRKYYYQLIVPLEKELKFNFNLAESKFATVDLPQKTGQRAKPINLNFQIYGKMKTV